MLKSTLAAVAAVFAISAFSPAMAAKGDPHVLLTTSAGNIELELNSQKAPISVDNFLKYVNSGFYNNTTFHRVIPGFMVQGGGFNEQMQQKQPNPPIKNEADNGLRNTRGTIAMARTADQDSATSQFFINIADNAFLDHGQRDFGYAVFGKVVKGMDVADKISQVPTHNVGPYQNVPSKPIVILSAKSSAVILFCAGNPYPRSPRFPAKSFFAAYTCGNCGRVREVLNEKAHRKTEVPSLGGST